MHSIYCCDVATKGAEMIDIICEGGTVLYGIQIPFQAMQHLLEDGVIPDDEFMELEFEDGTHGQIKKKSIIGFYEVGSTQA